MATWTKFDSQRKVGGPRAPETDENVSTVGWSPSRHPNPFADEDTRIDKDVNDSTTSQEKSEAVREFRDDPGNIDSTNYSDNVAIGETSKSSVRSGVRYVRRIDDRARKIDEDVENDRGEGFARENGFVVAKDDSEDEIPTDGQREVRRMLRDDREPSTRDNCEDGGSRIRRDARRELDREPSQQTTSKRPDSLYRDDAASPQRRRTIFSDANLQFGSTSKIRNTTVNKNISATPGNSVETENSMEKLVNGKSPIDGCPKNVHHVQFNRNSRTKRSQTFETNVNQHQTSSTSSTSDSSSSDDNSSCGYSEARPPDGGWGWVVVAASFMVNLIADGITFSFGVIYVEFLNYFKEGKSKTAWIGSLFMAMPLLSGPVASFLTDRYGCRRVTIAGSIMATAGFVISAYTNSMELLILTFGVVAGFGLSLCFVAAVVIVAYYFDKRRSFATGLSVCGSGIGTFIFAPVTHYLLAEYGWRGTTLILAGFFFNLAVCGCLMRDLEWTTIRAKEKTAERRANRERKRTRIQSSSGDSFSASSSANTTTQTPHGDPKRSFASTNAMLIESLRQQDDEEAGKLFSSLVSLPTFVKNGEKVPLEVLELLSTRKNVYNVLLQNYPGLLISSRSFSDSGTLNETVTANQSVEKPTVTKSSPIKDFPTEINPSTNCRNADAENPLQIVERTGQGNENSEKNWQHQDAAYLWWLKKINPDSPLRKSATLETHRRLPTAYLKDIRVHRHSLTYRGAMLNINRYRLRASSCPDIYRNSMTTIAKSKLVSYAGLWEFWDLLVDMLDFSHFSDSRFLLFSISNFLLHTWYDVPYVYLTDNAIEMGFSEADASILISVIGIMNMIGEICLGWAGDRAWVNPSFVYAICMILCGGVTGLIPMVIRDYWGLCTVAGAFGLFIAANYSLTSIILVEVITLDRFTNAYGLLLLVQGIANLMGPPLAGWIYDITGKYDLSFYLAGFFIALSGLLMMVMPLIEFYRKCKSPSEPEKSSPSRQFAKINRV